MIIVGLDPGTHTGVAVWDCAAQRFQSVQALPVHRALEFVGGLIETTPLLPVIFEDARQRKWFGHDARQKQQGAGAAKRDAAIWDDFLEDKGVPYLARCPAAGSTKWPADRFRNLTGWTATTNEHARDAGVLVFGYRVHEAEQLVRSWEQRRANQAAHASTRR